MAGLNQLLTRSAKTGPSNILDGAKSLSAEGENFVDFPRIPTGIFPFDYASGGGIPCNVPTQFYGPYQGGKSTLAYLAAKSLSTTCMRCLKPVALCACKEPDFHLVCETCKKPAGECSHKSALVERCAVCGKSRLECGCGSRLMQKTFLCHLEGLPPDELYFNTLGYHTLDNLIIGVPEYGEQACEMLEAALRADDCGLVIMDSLAALLPKAEMDGAYEDIQIGAQARLVSKLFRRIPPLLVQEYRRGHLVGVVFTVYVKDHEWPRVAAWVYDHWNWVSGIAFLPYDGGVYQLMPYEEISKSEYKARVAAMPVLDFADLPQYEEQDSTTGARELACTGGACDI